MMVWFLAGSGLISMAGATELDTRFGFEVIARERATIRDDDADAEAEVALTGFSPAPLAVAFGARLGEHLELGTTLGGRVSRRPEEDTTVRELLLCLGPYVDVVFPVGESVEIGVGGRIAGRGVRVRTGQSEKTEAVEADPGMAVDEDNDEWRGGSVGLGVGAAVHWFPHPSISADLGLKLLPKGGLGQEEEEGLEWKGNQLTIGLSFWGGRS